MNKRRIDLTIDDELAICLNTPNCHKCTISGGDKCLVHTPLNKRSPRFEECWLNGYVEVPKTGKRHLTPYIVAGVWFGFIVYLLYLIGGVK